MYMTRNQANLKAIKYNPSIATLLKTDPDYCIRGMVYCKEVNMYCDFDYWLTTVKRRV